MSGHQQEAREWICPLKDDDLLLGDVYERLRSIGLDQEDIPWLVQLIENPKFDLPGFDLFPGATDLYAHDHLHILLGRGLRAKDEAFVLGFTMGSTNRMNSTLESLYAVCAKYLFPRAYRFNDEDIHVFKDAVCLGFISDCTPLDKVDFTELHGMTIGDARRSLGIERALLNAYFEIEKLRYPDSVESQRLV